MSGGEGKLSVCSPFSPVKSLSGVGSRASEVKQSSEVSCTQEGGRQREARTQARGQERGQGSSSDGIHRGCCKKTDRQGTEELPSGSQTALKLDI